MLQRSFPLFLPISFLFMWITIWGRKPFVIVRQWDGPLCSRVSFKGFCFNSDQTNINHCKQVTLVLKVNVFTPLTHSLGLRTLIYCWLVDRMFSVLLNFFFFFLQPVQFCTIPLPQSCQDHSLCLLRCFFFFLRLKIEQCWSSSFPLANVGESVR